MGYLTLFQTLEKLKGIPAPYQPHGIAQLANACMKDKIIPVFQYNAYALEHVSGTGENSEYITIPIRGYLTHNNLSNVFNWTNRKDKNIEFTEAVIYELTQKEELLYENKTILLAKKTFHNLRPFGNAKSKVFDVSLTNQTKLYSSSNEKDAERIRELGGIEISQSDLLFPTTQVESYIDSFICEYEKNYSSLRMGTPTITQTEPPNNDQLIKALAAAKAQITSLESDLKQANADNDQLRLQASKPADIAIDEGQGDTLLILGAVMDCIKEVAKPNYTQQSLITAITDRYQNTSSLTQSTLSKKFPKAKSYLKQHVTH